jgi:23S rRNA (adenine-N6)-dimethyltransferase
MPRARQDTHHTPNRPTRSQRDHNRRVLSQNFLRDSSAVRRYLSMVEIEMDSLVLEVGAGDGAITKAIAPRCRDLHAYEIDPFHARKLAERVREHPNVRVVTGDFLVEKPPAEQFAVVGNVPFSITSKVVDWCIEARTMSTATIITQLEYAKKRTGGYGRWSLRTIETWPWVSWELRGKIPRHDFRPVPRVDAGVLHIARRHRPLVSAAKRAAYERMVELGFGGVGGSLYQSLVRRYPAGRVAAAFRDASVERDTVVAFVAPEEWLRIFELLNK